MRLKTSIAEFAPWQLAFLNYWARDTSLGNEAGLFLLLQREADDSLFSGAVAKTFKEAYELGYNVGVEYTLEELTK